MKRVGWAANILTVVLLAAAVITEPGFNLSQRLLGLGLIASVVAVLLWITTHDF